MKLYKKIEKFGGHDGIRTRICAVTAIFSRTAEQSYWKRAPVVDHLP